MSGVIGPVKRATVFRGKAGIAIPALASTAFERTEHLDVEQELRDQKYALDQHAIVATTDVQGTITYANDNFCVISKYTRDELLGQNHRILNSGYHSREFFQEMYRTITNGMVWHGEIRNRAKDGSLYWVDATIVPFLDPDGKPRQYMAIRTDITERKRAQEAREHLAAVVESSDDAIIGKDLNGTITAWNRGAQKVFGYSASEAVGKPMLMLFPPGRENEESDVLARIRRGESVEHFETVRIRKDGKRIDVSVTISPIKDSRGAIVGASKIARDITERKQTEERLAEQTEELTRQSEELGRSEQAVRKINDELELRVVQRTAQLAAANHELEAFTYSVSHDLRAPLRHISGFSRILAEDFGPAMDPEARQHLQRIEDGAHRMGLLVDELLNLARVGRHTLKLQVSGLNSIVEEVVSLLQPDIAGRAVSWKIADLPSAKCDPVLIKQVFQNLIANALKFTRPRERTIIEIGSRRKNGQMVIMTRDNGVGFNMKYSDKLFGVFQRLHRAEEFEGTGIGLATVHRIIHKHGGRVWAQSELDKGATFYFTLEAAKTTEVSANAMTNWTAAAGA
jgi:PAS domain S-box-containing protein